MPAAGHINVRWMAALMVFTLLCSVPALPMAKDATALQVNAAPILHNGYAISCPGASDGVVNTIVSGGQAPYSFLWTGPGGWTDTTANVSGLPPGPYDLQVIDALGEVHQQTLFLHAPPALSLTATLSDHNGTNISCASGSDGSIDLHVTGGAGSTLFLWSGPNGFSSSSKDIAALSAGIYDVLVTDANGCTITAQYTLIEPTAILPTLTASTYVGGHQVSCAGANDGSIDLNIQGGSSPYDFQWTGPNGYANNSQDIGGLEEGTYHVIITDANGCVVNNSITLTGPDEIEIELNSPTYAGGYEIPCPGMTNGVITTMVTGGTPGYAYQWSNPGGMSSTTADLDTLSAGIYSLLLTDANGCTATTDQTLNAPDPLVFSAVVSDFGGYQVSCAGNDGSIDLSMSGGVPPYRYEWSLNGSPFSTDEDLTGLDVGVYDLIVFDENDCKIFTQFTLSAPTPITASYITSDHNGWPISCPGTNDGSIDLTITGGASPWIVSWTGPNGFSANTQDIFSLVAGTYSLQITGASGCEGSLQVMLDAPDTLQVSLSTPHTNSGHHIACSGDSSGTITSNVTGGTAPNTYLWSGPNGFSYNAASPTDLTVGQYAVQVTDVNGCQAQQSILLTEPANELSVSLSSFIYPSGTHISCYGMNDGSIDATVIGGNTGYTYQWQGPGGSTFSSEDLSGVVAGQYQLLVTDTNQCTLSIATTLFEPDPLFIDSLVTSDHNGQTISCAGSSDGSVTVHFSSGNLVNSVQWTGPNGFTASLPYIDQLAAGAYQVTVGDINGCTIDQGITLSGPDSLWIDLDAHTFTSGSHISCFGENDGSVTANITGGTVGYALDWNGPNGFSSNTPELHAIAPGTYCVVVNDTNNCSANACVTLIEPSELQLSASAINETCSEQNGSIDLAVIGGSQPYTFLWNDGSQTEDLHQKSAGNYSVLVTDANGCSEELSITLEGDPGLELDVAISNTICHGSSDGWIDLEVTEGHAPYSFSWDNGSHNEDLHDVPAGEYIVYVQDANGCSFHQTFTVHEFSPLVLQTTLSTYDGGYNVSTFGGSDGSISVDPSGAAPPFTYQWSNSATGPMVSGLPHGEHSVTITDGIGCIRTFDFYLEQPLALQMPTAFSPNGDGANDHFVVHGLEAHPQNEINILNRWGNVVYATRGYRNDWNGTGMNGQPLPDATYFVLLKVEEVGLQLKGYVDLRR